MSARAVVVGLTPLAAPIAIKSAARFGGVRRPPARIHEASRARRLSARIPRAGLIALSLACLPAAAALADPSLPALAIKSAADGAQTYSLTFQVLILMTVLTLLPAILLAMTAFTRIIIVLSILRQALGMATTPSNQVLIGPGAVPHLLRDEPDHRPVLRERHQALHGRPARRRRWRSTARVAPLKKFMLAQTRESDICSSSPSSRGKGSSRAARRCR